MTPLAPPLVPAAWGAINTALVVLLAGFGAKATVIGIYAGAAALAELLALAVWYSRRRESHTGLRHLPNGDSIPVYAATVLIAGLAFAFYWPLAPVALAPLFLAVTHQLSQRHGAA